MSAKAALDGERSSLLGWRPRVFLAYVEGVIRLDEEQSKTMDRLYEQHAPKPVVDRAAQIADFLKRVG